MAELITEQELNAMRSRGATIKREPREVASAELTGAMNEVAKAVADKKSDDVVNAISGLTEAVQKSKASPLDLKPVLDTLSRLVQVTNNKPAYRFNITRNSRGQMISVTATPESNGD